MSGLLLAAALVMFTPHSVTAYTHTGNLMANGKRPILGQSVACPRELVFGTRLWIEGVGVRVCQDRGGAITKGRLDLFVDDYATAIRWGRQQRWVWVMPRRRGE